jgi:hypothetical protein
MKRVRSLPCHPIFLFCHPEQSDARLLFALSSDFLLVILSGGGASPPQSKDPYYHAGTQRCRR